MSLSLRLATVLSSSPCFVLVTLLCATPFAFAQTGVSDGPGSLDSIGDNASVDPNMG
ncbi:MAG: hypothetical protein GY822_18140 [Deltaproteobacteria bacterium]|nr:hypothetical protein [Deltaproteobacteria bacterium]